MSYRRSGRERGAAATGGGGIRVIKGKPAVFKARNKIDLHAEQVNGMGFIHNDFQVVDFKSIIIVLLKIKTQHVRKPGAAAALDANTQAIVGRNIFLRPDCIELLNGAIGDLNRRG